MRKIVVIIFSIIIFANIANGQNQDSTNGEGLQITTTGVYVAETSADEFKTLDSAITFNWFIEQSGKYTILSSNTGIELTKYSLHPDWWFSNRKENVYSFTMQDGNFIVFNLKEDRPCITKFKKKRNEYYDFVQYPIVELYSKID